MTTSSERRERQIGSFFATHADRLWRAVRHSAHLVGDGVIEDACQVAWTTLLRRADVTLDARGFSWLAAVALHEAWRVGSTAREQPAGIFTSDPEHEPGELPEPADTAHRSTDTMRWTTSSTSNGSRRCRYSSPQNAKRSPPAAPTPLRIEGPQPTRCNLTSAAQPDTP